MEWEFDIYFTLCVMCSSQPMLCGLSFLFQYNQPYICLGCILSIICSIKFKHCAGRQVFPFHPQSPLTRPSQGYTPANTQGGYGPAGYGPPQIAPGQAPVSNSQPRGPVRFYINYPKTLHPKCKILCLNQNSEIEQGTIISELFWYRRAGMCRK